MKRILSLILSASLALLSAEALAVKVGQAEIPATMKAGGKELKLNGAGERKQMGVITIYVAALYLEQPSTSAAEVLNSKTAKRLTMTLQKPLPTSILSNLFYDAIAKNTPPAEMPALKDRLESMKQKITTFVTDPKPGDVITYEMLPGKGVNVYFSAKPGAVESMGGDDFGRALLRIWLGDKPAEESLKQALLKGGM